MNQFVFKNSNLRINIDNVTNEICNLDDSCYQCALLLLDMRLMPANTNLT